MSRFIRNACQSVGRSKIWLPVILFLGIIPAHALAWGQRGHGAVGVLAVERLSEGTRNELAELLGSTDSDDVVGACLWPDVYRDMGDGRHTAPQHWVNLPEGEQAYRWERDCLDGQCVTEAVNDHAARLANASLDRAERRLAFKFLCHFLGDLHQPLHVGYADDQGGNLVTIDYRGQSMTLHRYWDSGLIERKVGSMEELVALLRDRKDQPPRGWTPGDTYAWTNESAALMRNFAYPATRTIDEGFEQRSWNVTQQQLDVASGRLAAVLEWALGEAD